MSPGSHSAFFVHPLGGIHAESRSFDLGRIWFPDWSKARFDKTTAQEGAEDEVS